MSRPGKPTPAQPRLGKFHGEFAAFEEGYIRSYISLADTKGAWTFTISSALIAYLIGTESARRALLTPGWTVPYLILLTAVSLLTLSAFCSFLVVAPRLKSPSGEGIVFFGAVAIKPNAAGYISEVAAHDEDALTEARLKHCYDISRVCQRKYRWLKAAIWFGLPGVGLGLVRILVS
jgi:hypothetical protein